MVAAKPIVLTQRAAVSGEPAPEPLVLVGKMPSGAFTETALTAVPASFADLAAARAAVNTLVTELKASPFFS